MQTDVSLFGVFCEDNYRAVLAWLRRAYSGDDRCEDWAQETMLRAWTLRDRFDGRNPAGWLISLARNVAWGELRPDRDHRGGSIRPQVVPLDGYVEEEPEEYGERWYSMPAALVAPDWGEPEACVLRSEERRAVWSTLTAITPRQRLALWRFYAHGMTAAEQARESGEHPNAIKARRRLGCRYFLRHWNAAQR